ncbi:AIF_HP2_G0052030.mRNA.1.CDS.1 [Saccharomyces cerevisiae]|nr:AIF_HP2_G0052030.mRNA.1.CDS.1 [Saccharomyces cerevisiae]CAI6795082.1 AIF_HP2_G0052030.mRNA.1.CDS.1 [Saccharomyces cerevisiae]
MAAVGDYLGEGDDKNIAIMHAFVDEFDFTGMSIVDALRSFLQSFRLPGEGQKIDRFMLKFAERFVDQNPESFQRRILHMCFQNNEGIDNGRDLPRDFLEGLFNEIANNEIKLISEQHQAMLSGDTNLVQQQQSAFN